MRILETMCYYICLFVVDKLWPTKDDAIILEIKHNHGYTSILIRIWDMCSDYCINYEDKYYGDMFDD